MDPKYYRTVHLTVIGASIGLILAGALVWMGRITHIPQDKWFIPLIVGVVFLVMEYVIQRKPK